jgi:hypothetical protein
LKNASIATHDREAHWQATRAELESIQKRGNLVTTVGLLLLCALLALNVVQWRQITPWSIFWAATTLSIVAISMWFVITRKRRLAESRGLICGACNYKPHDTEIQDVIDSRMCPRCEEPLGH